MLRRDRLRGILGVSLGRDRGRHRSTRSFVAPYYRFEECGVGEQYWTGEVYSMSDEEFTAFATAAAPCFQQVRRRRHDLRVRVAVRAVAARLPGRQELVQRHRHGLHHPSLRLRDLTANVNHRRRWPVRRRVSSCPTAPNETCTTPALSMTAIAGWYGTSNRANTSPSLSLICGKVRPCLSMNAWNERSSPCHAAPTN